MLRNQLRRLSRNSFSRNTILKSSTSPQQASLISGRFAHSASNSINSLKNSPKKGVLLLTSIAIATCATFALTSPLSNEAPEKPAKKISVEEFVKHNKPDDCWIVVNGQVYDFTDFISQHPGGRFPLIRNAGFDASETFNKLHAKGTIELNLPKEKHLGEIEGEAPVIEEEMDEFEYQRQENIANIPPLGLITNVHDFEHVAKNILSRSAWGYYSSGADDEITLRENHYAYQRIYFRPRILVDVKNIDTSTTMLGSECSVPFYATATALAKLGHPDGECSIARGTGKEGVAQMLSTLSSCSIEEVAEARVPGATQWFQLYVNEDRNKTKDLINRAEKAGMKAIFLTVDAPSLGNREKDRKAKAAEAPDVDLAPDAKTDQGNSRALSTFIDASLSWKDVEWIKQQTKLPLLIKGIQRIEDVVLAIDAGCSGVVLSNHGGRQLDTSPPPIELLAEIVPQLKAMGKLRPGFEIFVDGGVRRASDILKAVAIGGSDVKVSVGIGRPFLYANSGYGEEGVRKLIQILKEEMMLDMRSLGVRSIKELDRSFIDTRRLIGRDARDMLYNHVYSPLQTVQFTNHSDD